MSTLQKIGQRKKLEKKEIDFIELLYKVEGLPNELKYEIKQYIGSSNYAQWPFLLRSLEKIPISRTGLSCDFYNMYCASSSNDSTVVFGSNDFCIARYDTNKKSLLKDCGYQASAITCVDDNRIAIGHSKITLLHPNLDEVEPSLEGHPNSFITSLISIKNGALVSGDKDGKIKIWDLRTFECLKEIEHHKGQITCLLELSNGWLACGSKDMTISLWDMKNYALKQQQLRFVPISSMAQLQDGRLAIGLSNSLIELWNVEDDEITDLNPNNLRFETLHLLMCKEHFLLSLTEYSYQDDDAIDAAMKLLRGQYRVTLKIWDTTAHSMIREIVSYYPDPMRSACLLKNKKLVTGHDEGLINIWNCTPYLDECIAAKKMLKKASLFDIIYLKMIQDFNGRNNECIGEAENTLGKESALVYFLQKLKEKVPKDSSCTIQ